MKKLATILICLLTIAMMAFTANAVGGDAFTVAASNDTLDRGDTVTLTFTVKNAVPATSYGLMLSFDTTVFEVVEGKCEAVGALVKSFDATKNAFLFMFDEPVAHMEAAAVGTVTLKVKNTAAFGDHTVTCTSSAYNGATKVAIDGCEASFNIRCVHTYAEEWSADADTHFHECTRCGDRKDVEGHSLSWGATVCDVCRIENPGAPTEPPATEPPATEPPATDPPTTDPVEEDPMDKIMASIEEHFLIVILVIFLMMIAVAVIF